MSEQTFQDKYGDDVVVSNDNIDGEALVFLKINDRNRSCTAALPTAVAQNVARALVGGVATDAMVRASEVSFNEGLLRLAAVHAKTVTFRYVKGNGDVIEQRRLIPADVREITTKQGTHMTFVGHDPDRDEVRAYRVDRMRGEVSVAA